MFHSSWNSLARYWVRRSVVFDGRSLRHPHGAFLRVCSFSFSFLKKECLGIGVREYVTGYCGGALIWGWYEYLGMLVFPLVVLLLHRSGPMAIVQRGGMPIPFFVFSFRMLPVVLLEMK
ncbi:MAG: hypothetical protein NZL83_00775 [Candidatus Absconditabacterales bacterium]|nr:hypothetical protein [Candidatus Absconditabacterales bacterium]